MTFFGGDTQFSRPSVTRPSVSIRLRCPRARDERGAKHRLLVEYFLDGCLGKSSVCALSLMFPWLVLGEEMEVVRSHPNRDNLTSRTRCVWGNTVAPEHPLHHNEQDLSIAKPCRPKQVHSTFRGASSVPSPWFFGWDICSSLSSSSFGVWTACSADSLVPTSLSVTDTGDYLTTLFHCHRVPDAFQSVLDSWKFEDHWTVRAPLVCSISGVFSSGRREVLGDFPGLCKILHETTPLVGNPMGSPSCIPVFFYFCRYRFGTRWLVDDGSYWSTMGCDSFNVGLPGPAAAPRGSGRGLLSRPLVSPL